MILLEDYLKNELLNIKLSDKDKERLIVLDKRYGDLYKMTREEFNEKDVRNLKEEMETFLSARKRGRKYFPIIDLGDCGYDEDLIRALSDLRIEFERFDNVISRFYIESLDNKIRWVKYHYNAHRGNPYPIPIDKLPSTALYNKAMNAFLECEYVPIDKLDRNIDAQHAQKVIDKALDDLGYDWHTSLEDNMLSRMNVTPDGIIRINKNSYFNDADLEGLIAHEIKGHIARRHWGKKTGLNLFLYGLPRKNFLDEGLAVWNSLNLVEHDKPNVMYNITLKYIISYCKYHKDFCELFDFVKDISNGDLSDAQIFSNIVRSKREVRDMSVMGGILDDGDYYAGYLAVDSMTDEMRDDIMKYNIGPQYIKDLPLIKQFFAQNQFKELE